MDTDLLIECCVELSYRNNERAGTWRNFEIPQCFHEFRKRYFPMLSENDHEWLWVTEAKVLREAADYVARSRPAT